jgi:hypothetical protein
MGWKREQETVDLDACTVKHETDKAFLVVYEDAEVWLPKSQIIDGEGLEVGEEPVTIRVTEWLAKQKELI